MYLEGERLRTAVVTLEPLVVRGTLHGHSQKKECYRYRRAAARSFFLARN
jgi:hypothetical protein